MYMICTLLQTDMITMPAPHYSIFTGQVLLFVMPNQQGLSTEDNFIFFLILYDKYANISRRHHNRVDVDCVNLFVQLRSGRTSGIFSWYLLVTLVLLVASLFIHLACTSCRLEVTTPCVYGVLKRVTSSRSKFV